MRSHMPRIALALLFAVAIVGTHALTSEADGSARNYFGRDRAVMSFASSNRLRSPTWSRPK